jgi:hypothetical protein
MFTEKREQVLDVVPVFCIVNETLTSLVLTPW